MAPPELFVKTKTLDVEKLEKDVADGLKTESMDRINTSAVEEEDVAKGGKEDVAKAGCSFFCLRFVSMSCIGLGITSIAAAVSVVHDYSLYSTKKTCLPFRLL